MVLVKMNSVGAKISTVVFFFVLILRDSSPYPLLEQSHDHDVVENDIVSTRAARQGPIVQPNWSFDPGFNLFEDFDVRVTEEKLEETEAIRGYIKETVHDGTYAVELSESDFNEEHPENEQELRSEKLSEPNAQLEVEDIPESEASPQDESGRDAEPVPEPDTQPDAEPESEPESKPESEPETQPDAEPESESEPEPQPTTTSAPVQEQAPAVPAAPIIPKIPINSPKPKQTASKPKAKVESRLAERSNRFRTWLVKLFPRSKSQ